MNLPKKHYTRMEILVMFWATGIFLYCAWGVTPVQGAVVQCTAGCFLSEQACQNSLGFDSDGRGNAIVYRPEGSGNTTTCPETQVCCVRNTAVGPNPPSNCTSLQGTCKTTCAIGSNERAAPSCSATLCVGPEAGKTFCEVIGGGTSPPPSIGPAPTLAPGTCPAGFIPKAGVCFPTGTGLSEASVAQILTRVASWLLGVLGFVALMAFIISGLQYLFASGSDDIITIAKRNMSWSIVGVIVGLSGVIIIRMIERLLAG